MKDDICNPLAAAWLHDTDTVSGLGNLSVPAVIIVNHYLTLIDKTTSLNGCLSFSSQEREKKNHID